MASKYKIISIIILLMGIAVFLTSCDPEEYLDPTNRVLHYVKNNTNDDLIIKRSHGTSVIQESTIILKKDSIALFSTGALAKETNYFETIFQNIVIDISIFIYSKDSVLLKTWNRFYTDNTQKQFFRESDWVKRVYEKNEGKIYKYHEYTFTINQEDLN